MKNFLVMCFSMLSLMAIANDEPLDVIEEVDEVVIEEPTQEQIVSDLKIICNDWAAEDNIAQAEKPAYILDCINTELRMQGYPTLDNIN